MKIKASHKVILVLVSLVLPMLASADQISMLANDPGGTSSLISAGQWSDGQPPNATNDYFSSVYFIRTPGDANNHTFAGHSLTLQTPTTDQGTATPIRSIIYKGSGGNIYTIDNLTNAGGVINSGSGNVTAPTFTGNLMTVISNSTIQGDQGTLNIGYPLAGSADLTNASSGAAHGVTYTTTSTNSAFTGRFIINENATMTFNSIYNVPGNPATPTPGQITIYNNCTFWDNAGITYSNSNGGITLAGTGATITTTATNASGGNLPTTISVPITDNGAGYTLTKRGGGILTLSGDNTFSGGLTLLVATAGSQLNINSPTAIGSGPFVLASGAVAPAILDNTSGSSIVLANNNSQVWSNSFLFLGSSSLDMGSGTVTLGTSAVATVSNNVFSVGPISDGGLGYSLTKAGAGTLIVNGGISITGDTIVSNGVLTLAGSGSLSSSNIFLAADSATLDVAGLGGLTLANGQVLGGSGNISGAVTADNGALIAPGGDDSFGTLAINGDLVLKSSALLNFDLSGEATPGGGTNDLIIVTGALNITGPVAMNISGDPVNGETYTLIQYGTFSGSTANLSVPGFIVTNNTAAKAIQLVKVHVPGNLTWRGDGSANVWDVGITPNWSEGGSNQIFLTGDFVTFDDSGSVSPPVDLSGFISPGATVVNSSHDYDFTGSGILSGNLTKTGTGTLILENNNSYDGGTIINGGILQVGNNNETGTLGNGIVTNNASLVFSRTNSYVATNNITGSGTITLSGTGDLILSGSNSYSGWTTISSAGILHPRSTNALGSGNVINTSGGKLYVDVNVDLPNSLTLGGGTALEKGGAGVSTLSGAITLTSDTTLSVDGGATLNLTNASGINGSSVNANVTLTGGGAGNITGPISLGSGNLTVSGGTWTVGPTNSYSGLTTISAGALLLTGPLSLGQPPASFNFSQVTLSGGSLGAASDVTLADGKIGIDVNDASSASGIMVSSNATFVISNNISGSGSAFLTKRGPGTLVLEGANDFAGQLNLDSLSTSANDGMTVIANNAAIQNILALPGFPFIYIRNNNGGSSTLGLDGSNGSINIAPDISLAGRNVVVPAIENLVGDNTVSGNLTLVVGGSYYIQSDSGTLTLAMPLPYQTPSGTRTFLFSGDGTIDVTGGIQNGSTNVSLSAPRDVPVNVVKNGNGILELSAANSYSGTTLVNGGILNVTGSLLGTNTVTVAGGLLVSGGSITGPVTVQSGGAIEAGTTNTIGTLSLAGALSLSGNTIVKINAQAGTSDLFSGQSSVSYGGILTVTNLGGTPSAGDSFTLFSPGTSAGNFSGISGTPGPDLHYSFTNGVLTVENGSAIANNQTNITVSVSGNTLNISWPSDHRGWILQAQTNSVNVGLSDNWHDVAGSDSVTNETITINSTNPAVFYRLRHP